MLLPTHDFLGFQGQFLGSSGGVVAVAPYGVLTTQTPEQQDAFGTIELFTKITTTAPGRILGARFWKTANDIGTHTARIWSSAPAVLVSKDFTGETASGWQTVMFDTPYAWDGTSFIMVNVICYGDTPRTINGLATPITNGTLATLDDDFNGMWTLTPGNPPDSSSLEQNFFRDIIFLPD